MRRKNEFLPHSVSLKMIVERWFSTFLMLKHVDSLPVACIGAYLHVGRITWIWIQ